MFDWLRHLRKSQVRYPGDDGQQQPVFVFAACWRTGSTLVQRIITASGEIFVWGEPAFLPEAKKLHDRAAEFFRRAAKNRKQGMGKKTGQWIPIVCPLPEQAVLAMRAYFETLYVPETRELGFNRWGFKEVRPGAREHIELLAEVFPEARFVFLMRDPYETFRSIKGKKFHARFKDPFQPVEVWKNNVQSCLVEELPASIRMHVLRYESLTSSKQEAREAIQDLARFLSIPVTARMFDELSLKVDSSGGKHPLTNDEVRKIESMIDGLDARFGYRPQQ